MIGKPYAGKLHVRFDEGELEIGLLSTTPVLYSTELKKTWLFITRRTLALAAVNGNPINVQQKFAFLKLTLIFKSKFIC